MRSAPFLQEPVMKGRTVPSRTSATTTHGTAGPSTQRTRVRAWSTRIVDVPPISTETKNITSPIAL